MNKEVEVLKALASRCLRNTREINQFPHLENEGKRKEAVGPCAIEPSTRTHTHTHTCTHVHTCPSANWGSG